MSDKWHDDHKKAVAKKWTRCPPVTMKIKELISGQVCMGTYGLVELEVMQLERELAEARAEIESKNKLIEQMWSALKIVKAHMHKTGDFYAIDDVNAALSAAERR